MAKINFRKIVSDAYVTNANGAGRWVFLDGGVEVAAILDTGYAGYGGTIESSIEIDGTQVYRMIVKRFIERYPSSNKRGMLIDLLDFLNSITTITASTQFYASFSAKVKQFSNRINKVMSASQRKSWVGLSKNQHRGREGRWTERERNVKRLEKDARNREKLTAFCSYYHNNVAKLPSAYVSSYRDGVWFNFSDNSIRVHSRTGESRKIELLRDGVAIDFFSQSVAIPNGPFGSVMLLIRHSEFSDSVIYEALNRNCKSIGYLCVGDLNKDITREESVNGLHYIRTRKPRAIKLGRTPAAAMALSLAQD
jgi:hypothetical protein